MNSRVTAPVETLIRGEFTRALSFEEENALTESIVIVMTSGDCSEQEEEYGEDVKCGNRG